MGVPCYLTSNYFELPIAPTRTSFYSPKGVL